jgi:hypothetical protein
MNLFRSEFHGQPTQPVKSPPKSNKCQWNESVDNSIEILLDKRLYIHKKSNSCRKIKDFFLQKYDEASISDANVKRLIDDQSGLRPTPKLTASSNSYFSVVNGMFIVI